MARLRTVLKLYYGENPDAPVLIDIPKGGSRPLIVAAERPLAPPPAEATSGEAKPKVRFRRRGDLRPRAPAMLGGLAVLGTVAALWLLPGGRPKSPHPEPRQVNAPLVLVAPVVIATSDAGIKALERGLKAEMVAELSSYPWLSVAFRSESRTPLEAGQSGRSIYVLGLNLTVEQSRFDTVATLQDAVTGEIRWSHREVESFQEGQRFPALAGTARRVAAEIGRPLGPLTTAEIDTWGERTGGDYGCLLKLRAYTMEWAREAADAFRACAQGIASGQSAPSPLAMALEAVALVGQARRSRGEERESLMSSAETLVRRALAARSSYYLLLSTESQLAACRSDRGRYAAIRAEIVRRRGNDPDALTQLAFLDLFSFGDAAAAEDLSLRARRLSLDPQPLDAVTPAMLALLAGDAASARARLERPAGAESPTALLLLAIAQAETGDRESATKTLERLARVADAAPAGLRAVLEGECWTQEIRARLLRGVDRLPSP
jgi:TolB-like protein